MAASQNVFDSFDETEAKAPNPFDDFEGPKLGAGEDALRRVGGAAFRTGRQFERGISKTGSFIAPAFEYLGEKIFGKEQVARERQQLERQRRLRSAQRKKTDQFISEIYEGDPSRDSTVLAKGSEFAGAVAPLALAGPLAPVIGGLTMGGGSIQSSEAEGLSPEETNRRFALNLGGGTALNLVPIPGIKRVGSLVDAATENFKNRIVQETLRRGARAAVGGATGGVVNAGGDALIQLAESGEIDPDRLKQNLAVGVGSGIALGVTARPGSRPQKAQPELELATREPEIQSAPVGPTEADIRTEEANALQSNLQRQDQRTIDNQLRQQLELQYGRNSPAALSALGENYRQGISALPEPPPFRVVEEVRPVKSAETSAEVFRNAETQRLAEEVEARRAQAADIEIQRSTAELAAADAGAIPENIQLSPQARRMSDEFGGAAPEIITDPRLRALGGAAGGAAFGLSQGDTVEERLQNALLYGAGGATAAGLGPRAINALRRRNVGGPVKNLPENSRITIQEYVGRDGQPKKTVQIDLISPDGESRMSTSPEALAAEGYTLPNFADIPQGQYSGTDLQAIPSQVPDSTPPFENQELRRIERGLMSQGVGIRLDSTPDGALLIQNFLVGPSAQGQGLGSAALAQMREIADARQVPLTLVADAIEPARQADLVRFYERNGFTQAGDDPVSGKPIFNYNPQSQVQNAAQQGQVPNSNSIQYPQAGAGALPNQAGGGNRVPPGGQGPQAQVGGPDAPLPRNTSVPPDLEAAGMGGMARKFLDAKTSIVDYTAPVETLFRDFQRQYGYEVRPRDRITNLFSRAINARSIAGQFLRDQGYFQLLRDVPDLKEFDRYITDLHALDVEATGKETGVDLAKAQANIAANQERMQPYVDRLRTFSNAILAKGVEYGLIPIEKAAALNEQYPNYVPLNRVFDEAEISSKEFGTGRGVGSISAQGVFRKLLGSKREIVAPTASFLNKAETLFAQGERNRAASTFASYKDLPGWSDLLQPVANENSAPHTFSYLEDGQKRTVAAPKEIAEAVKALNVHQLGILGQVLAYPMRIFKAGTTGLEPSFAARNFNKDQFAAAIATRDLGATVRNFLPAIVGAIGHGPQYQELVRQGGMFTSFDVNRNSPELTTAGIRSGRSKSDRALYLARNPGELFRAVENVFSRPEEATRIQQFLAQFESDIKKGMPREDALVTAAEAARQTTADFSRHGNFGPIFKAFQPYLAPGIAGSRGLVRAFRRDPVTTTARVSAILLLPEFLSTAWNLSDEKRKEAYDDLSQYERDNNLILVPPNPVQDERGRWNVIKAPLPPGYSNFTRFIRRPMEQWAGLDPVSFGEMATAAAGTVSPIEPTKQGVSSNVVMQPVKPIVEIALNKDFFTGRDIIPESLQKQVPEYQYDRKTSGTSIWLGRQLGISPIQIDHAVKGYFGRGGTQIQNALDRSIARLSGDPEFQVGGRSVAETVERSFLSGQGGQNLNRFYQAHQEATRAVKTYNRLLNEGREEEAERFYQSNLRQIEAGAFMESQRGNLQALTAELRQAEEDEDKIRQAELRLGKSEAARNAVAEYRERMKEVDK